ncbi:hypothetical protein DFR49_2857 [Hephaestia caeni]|uniref:Uncharacterized protein n=1 Tax=Hephaestia caeni TaxID=645617 RepID=A0A397P4Y9_9SPHN|nr:hypothetical protein [Hephaestia caeni]RIA44610.1 hypothetical protein DFR49_2857 [Hephaestia caeni]
MAQDDPTPPPPAGPDRQAPAPLDDDRALDPDPPVDLDAFDPDEFEWRPVPRRPRADGWSPEVQRAFIEALADTGMVEHAARAVDMSVQSAYRLRRAAGSEGFARAWTAAVEAASHRLIDLAFRRAIEGEEVPVFDRDGCRIGAKWQHSDRLLMFLLRAYQPARFRHAHQSIRRPEEPLPAAAPPVADAVAALAPPCPAAPHRLMPPDRAVDAIATARAVAEAQARYPRDDREHYRRVPVEPTHPAAHQRAHRRHQREAGRDDSD